LQIIAQLNGLEWDKDLAMANAAIAPTPNETVALQMLEKALPPVPSALITTNLDEASQRLVEQVWNLMLSGRSTRVRRSWHVNFILLRRLSWLNPIIRPRYQPHKTRVAPTELGNRPVEDRSEGTGSTGTPPPLKPPPAPFLGRVAG
jgi:hypothetical protein